ncbi:transcriptional regulator [Clostridium perfringens]|uniref:Transcriptional regulator n=1 Tax=Clostridium perfringens TaxID=1502 RepID=A0AAW9I6C9_CLOPF
MEDIPYNLHTMVDIVGIENFLQICKMYGGSSIYIPVYNKMIMGDRNRRIVGEYDGKNIDRLRVRYDLSKEQVKYVLRKEGVIG